MQSLCLASEDDSQLLEFVKNQLPSIRAGQVYCELAGDGTAVIASVRADLAQDAGVNLRLRIHSLDRTSDICPE